MRMFVLSVTMALGWVIGNMAFAGDNGKSPEACQEVQTCGSEGCCSCCGRHCGCEKFCKIVCEMKDVKKTVWVVHCKEVCTMMPSCPLNGCHGGNCTGCKQEIQCEACQSSGGKCNVCASLENRNYRTPQCGRVRDQKTLEKKEVTCKVPSYKCVVVYKCQECIQEGKSAEPTPVTPAPAKSASVNQNLDFGQTPAAPMPPAQGI